MKEVANLFSSLVDGGKVQYPNGVTVSVFDLSHSTVLPGLPAVGTVRIHPL